MGMRETACHTEHWKNISSMYLNAKRSSTCKRRCDWWCLVSSHRKGDRSALSSPAGSSVSSVTVPVKADIESIDSGNPDANIVRCFHKTVMFLSQAIVTSLLWLWLFVSVSLDCMCETGQSEPRYRCWKTLQEEHQTRPKAYWLVFVYIYLNIYSHVQWCCISSRIKLKHCLYHSLVAGLYFL